MFLVGIGLTGLAGRYNYGVGARGGIWYSIQTGADPKQEWSVVPLPQRGLTQVDMRQGKSCPAGPLGMSSVPLKIAGLAFVSCCQPS